MEKIFGPAVSNNRQVTFNFYEYGKRLGNSFCAIKPTVRIGASRINNKPYEEGDENREGEPEDDTKDESTVDFVVPPFLPIHPKQPADQIQPNQPAEPVGPIQSADATCRPTSTLGKLHYKLGDGITTRVDTNGDIYLNVATDQVHIKSHFLDAECCRPESNRTHAVYSQGFIKVHESEQTVQEVCHWMHSFARDLLNMTDKKVGSTSTVFLGLVC